jgi:hypothetical protein
MSNQLFTNYDNGKIFVWDNRYQKGTFEYTNNDTDPVTFAAGTVVGRIHATGKIVPLTSGASDGSQFPVGILAEDITVEYGETYSEEAAFCNYGDVVEDKILFQGSDDLDTVVSARTLRDRIAADTAGIRIIPSTDLTGTDNA